MREGAQAFLHSCGWDDATPQAIAGDLSDRQYVRLMRGSDSVILMDAGDDARSTEAFVAMTRWLRITDLSAPKIIAEAAHAGLLLLEDLGDTPVRSLVTERTDGMVLDLIIDLLLALRNRPAAKLHRPDAAELCAWTTMADDFYPGAKKPALEAFRAVLEPVLSDALTDGTSVSLRDFHTDNMMWLPNRKGIAKLGLLDYQDAFLTHPVYDLVSLLTDARTPISPSLRKRYIAQYAKASGDEPDRLNLAFAAFSAQRNLRILGIFHRSAQVSGKTHHLPKVPRVYGYFREALGHPAFASIQDLVLDGLPAPKGTT